MKKVLITLADGFEEIEALATADILKRAGVDVVLAGVPGTMVKGRSGIRIIADKRIDDIKSEEFDCIVLPGGYPGYVNLGKSKRVIELVKDFDKQKKLVAAICASPSILAKAGILEDKKATIYPGMEREIPRPRSEKVVVDEHVITSQGPGTTIDFALEIVKNLLGKNYAEKIKKQIVYK
ncbi:MAG: DJ-1/PfpI family protein [Candidatus Aenigmatarchaeota archaeon]